MVTEQPGRPFGVTAFRGPEHEAAEHRSMLRAAEDGDAERAAALLRDHITSFAARNFVKPQENQNV